MLLIWNKQLMHVCVCVCAAYFSGRFRSGKSSCKSFTTSKACASLSTKQYLPLADGFSKARICALATSLTSTCMPYLEIFWPLHIMLAVNSLHRKRLHLLEQVIRQNHFFAESKIFRWWWQMYFPELLSNEQHLHLDNFQLEKLLNLLELSFFKFFLSDSSKQGSFDLV